MGRDDIPAEAVEKIRGLRLDRPVAFGQTIAVLAEHEGHVGVAGLGELEAFVQQDLAGGRLFALYWAIEHLVMAADSSIGIRADQFVRRLVPWI